MSLGRWIVSFVVPLGVSAVIWHTIGHGAGLAACFILTIMFLGWAGKSRQ